MREDRHPAFPPPRLKSGSASASTEVGTTVLMSNHVRKIDTSTTAESNASINCYKGWAISIDTDHDGGKHGAFDYSTT